MTVSAGPSVRNIALWTAIITPMREDGSIDFGSFEILLRAQEKCGNGVVLLGSTGEGMALSRKEKESVVEFACGMKLSIPLLAGLPGHQLEETLDWIRFASAAADRGVQGFLSVVPYYSKPGLIGQTNWFEKILNTSLLPVMIYNVPGRTGVKLNPQVLSTLKGHPRLWAVKESSGSVEDFKTYREANPDLSFYCGDDGLMPAFAEAGAVGLVSVASNVWPEATNRYVQLCLKNRTEGLVSLWKECSDTLFLASNPVPAKWLQHHLGLAPSAATRAPLDPRDLQANANGTEAVLKAHQRISVWLSAQKSQ